MQLTSLTSLLNNNKHHFHPVVKFDATTDKLLSFDFTSGNKELTNDILSDTNRFTTWVNEKLQEVNARYGIGGYKEQRTVYSISKVFDGDKPGEEPRRLHLGTDIWGKPHTAVMAPLDGIVHSFAFNNRFGDYGATIILSHLLNGVSFYTLYGHLSLNSIKNIQEGDRIEKGDVFGEFRSESLAFLLKMEAGLHIFTFKLFLTSENGKVITPVYVNSLKKKNGWLIVPTRILFCN